MLVLVIKCLLDSVSVYICTFFSIKCFYGMDTCVVYLWADVSFLTLLYSKNVATKGVAVCTLFVLEDHQL